MTAARLAIVHHPRSFHPPDLRAAIGDTLHPLWVLPDWPAHDTLSRRLLRRIGTVVEIAGAHLDLAAQALADHRPDAIITFVDDHVVLTAALAQRLGLSYHTPTVARTVTNKVRQRQAFTAAGIPGPRFWALPAGLSQTELSAVAAQVTYPGVLKPAQGSGSRGIMAIAGPDELTAAYRPHLEQIIEARLPDDPACAQPWGSYLSVESVVDAGRICHVALTGRFAPAEPFRETGNIIPAPVARSEHEPLCDLAGAAIRALGISTGLVHTEIKLTADGPRLIEVNGRLGGRPPFVLRQVSGVNLFAAACEVALGHPVRLDGPARCDGVGYWLMLQPPVWASRVQRVAGVDELARADFVDSVALNRGPGDQVDWREGTDGHVLTIRGRVSDHASLAAAVTEIHRRVQIEYDRR